MSDEDIHPYKYSELRKIHNNILCDSIPYNNRYTKSYLSLAKIVKEVDKIKDISSFLFYIGKIEIETIQFFIL